jgi:hypothetical protein
MEICESVWIFYYFGVNIVALTTLKRTSLAWILLLCFDICLVTVARAQDGNTVIEHLVLQNQSLKLELSTPASADNYRGTRFDRSGIFHKIEFQGHSLCERWHEGPLNTTSNDDVTGPCEEFGNGRPLGYEPGTPGSSFVKIGVGKLRQPEEDKYRFWFAYDVIEEGKWQVEKKSDSIVFSQALDDGNGIAYAYRKEVLLSDAGFTISHELKNTGTRTWSTDHYNHNFFLIDSDRVGPNYRIEFPFELKPTKEQALFKELVQLDSKKLNFRRVLEKGESYFAELLGHSRTVQDHAFEIHHPSSGVVIRCRGDAPLHKLNVWGMKNTICPEPYVEFSLEPNQSQTWKLFYSFSKTTK